MTGSQLAQKLNGAGFDGSAPGANVAVAACNSATPGASTPSVAQDVADGTGAETFGAMANRPAAAQAGTMDCTWPGSGPGAGPMVWGAMGAYPNNSGVVVMDGTWVSTTPNPTSSPAVHSTTGSPTVLGTGSVF